MHHHRPRVFKNGFHWKPRTRQISIVQRLVRGPSTYLAYFIMIYAKNMDLVRVTRGAARCIYERSRELRFSHISPSSLKIMQICITLTARPCTVVRNRSVQFCGANFGFLPRHVANCHWVASKNRPARNCSRSL
jgi:hypothetical protein